MDAKSDVRGQFLLEWIRQLIEIFPLRENMEIQLFQNQAQEIENSTNQLQQLAFAPYEKSFIPDALDQDSSGPKKITGIKEIEDSPKQNQIPSVKNPLNLTPVNLSKPANELERLILDPNIESIECRGMDEALILKTQKGITQTRISMNPEEIKSMLNKMAEEAHAPINNGLIRAETNIWSVFGIISDFGGIRFLIQKKRPANNPPYGIRMQGTQTGRPQQSKI